MEAENLLKSLGIRNYTQRHIRIIDDFIESKKTNLAILLSELGDYDEHDMEIAELWFVSIH